MLICTDLHIKPESEAIVFGEVLPGVQEIAAQKGDKQIACLGDVYTIRYNVSVRLQNQLYAFLQQSTKAGFTWHIVPGNHDQIDDTGANALEVLSEIPGVNVYTMPTTNEWGLWLPYRRDLGEILGHVGAFNPTGWNTCFTHLGFNGAMMNANLQDEGSLTPAHVAKFNRVFVGHYHKRQTLKNIVYVGTPYQTRADESGQAKGVLHTLDGKDFEWIDTAWGKRYHRITLGHGQTLDTTGFKPGDDVRVTTAPGVDPTKVAEQLAKVGITQTTVTPEAEAKEARLNVGPEATLEQYAQEYVKLIDPPFAHDALMVAYREVTQ